MKQKIKIYHLYPDEMNLYGDVGNIITLCDRCKWRGIEAEVINVFVGDDFDFSDCDLVFMGGGQDRGQEIVGPDLVRIGPKIKHQIDNGMVALTICGGFQLFGKYFQTASGKKIPGIGVFDAYTVAGDKRLIGNVVADISHTSTTWTTKGISLPPAESIHATLVGFENHSGRTFLEKGTEPLAYIIKGYGNLGDKGVEGGVYKNAYGTYLHGSLLPKNPWFADHLILMALYRRYGSVTELKALDDSIEETAHQTAIKRADTAKTLSI
jgi:CobQ-like glutamine amidotransferase family enzyme